PVGLVRQLAKRLRVTFAEQIARPLPAEDVARRVAPWRAAVFLVAGEEIEEQARLAEGPGATAASAAQDVAKELLGSRAREEVFLIRRALVGVARRHGDRV